MAAPEHVPTDSTRSVRAYASPPRRPEPWLAGRPGELVSAGQPRGARLGSQGPDQGYLLSLARRFEGQLRLTEGEHERDALAGAVAVGLRRASLFGRAPVIDDLTVALTIWGFLGVSPTKLVDARRRLFREVWHPHHYAELRRIVDLVPEEALRQSPSRVREAHRADYRTLLGDLSSAGS